MADKAPPIDINDPYRPADYDFGALYGSTDHKANWTDGLPQDFHGWGPQTPDPDAPADDSPAYQLDTSLTWAGEGDEPSHHVWRFDGGRSRQH